MYFYNACLCQWVIYHLSRPEEASPNYGVLVEQLYGCFFLFQLVTQMLMAYLSRLSAIAGNKINCGPALTWMEVWYEARVVLSFLTLAAEQATNARSCLSRKRCNPPRPVGVPEMLSEKLYAPVPST